MAEETEEELLEDIYLDLLEILQQNRLDDADSRKVEEAAGLIAEILQKEEK